ARFLAGPVRTDRAHVDRPGLDVIDRPTPPVRVVASGRCRQVQVRDVLTAPPGIALLEDQEVRNDAHRATRGLGGRTIGVGVSAQFATWFTIFGECISAAIAAVVAPSLVAFTFAGMVFQRELLR